jgi:hypothetical protein
MAQRGTMAFKTVEDLEAQVQLYFDSRTAMRKVYPRDADPYEEEYSLPLTMSGLADALGVDRKTLVNYGSDDKFPHVIARARRKVEIFAEEALFYSQSNRGAQFTLTVNHGWQEPQPGQGDSEHEQGLVMNEIPPATDRKAIAKFSEPD